jgi:hypothetical protein
MGENARSEYESRYTAEKNYEMLLGISIPSPKFATW